MTTPITPAQIATLKRIADKSGATYRDTPGPHVVIDGFESSDDSPGPTVQFMNDRIMCTPEDCGWYKTDSELSATIWMSGQVMVHQSERGMEYLK